MRRIIIHRDRIAISKNLLFTLISPCFHAKKLDPCTQIWIFYLFCTHFRQVYRCFGGMYIYSLKLLTLYRVQCRQDQQTSLHLFSDALCCIRVLGIPAGGPAGSVFTLFRKNASRSVSSVRQRSQRISLLSLRSLRLYVPHKAACSACRGKVPA